MDALSRNTDRPSYTVREIADWQLKRASAKVDLPDLQRGFVWKPYQTEILWDSVLRGFPVGTFILASPQDDQSEKRELLDGQQRATAIAFGFFDPWAENPPTEDLWRIKGADVPILWLDLGEAENPAVRFGFRLLTRSQPWGYERKDNQAPLSAIERRRFLSELAASLPAEDKGKRYLELPLKRFWPWDAKIPVPFAFLLSSFQTADWKNHLSSLCKRHYPTLRTKQTPQQAYLKQLDDFLAKPQAEELKSKTCSAIEEKEVPVLNVSREILEQQDRGTTASENGDDDVPDDVETLFIRINSAGTPLAGEELIYSIYKSIFPGTKKLVEDAGAHFMLPSRLVSLATRIVQADIQRDRKHRSRKAKTDGIALPQKARVREFRGLIYKKRSPFKKRLERFILSLKEKNIFAKALGVLCGPASFQLPSALAVDLARNAPEILFVLIYRLRRGDQIALGSERHRKVLGFLTALSWFGRGDKLKDHDGCLRYLWRDLLTTDQNAFWSRSVLKKTIQPQRSNDQLVMLPLLPPRRLSAFLSDNIIKKGKPWDSLETSGPSSITRWYRSHYETARASDFASEAWRLFLRKLSAQRGLVLYAQREFVGKWFDKFNHVGVENLVDTNCPWDWDHIHAQKLIKRKKSVDPSLKEWHSSIGNLRIWPMELNRSDADAVPSAKLSSPDDDSNPLFQMYDLADGKDILRASFIEKKGGFVEIGEECDIKTKAASRMIRHAILMRMVALYRHWFDELRLAKFFPE